MEHVINAPAPPPAGIDPAAALALPHPARKPRQCTADYRWTQPKVIAFLEALAQSGRVGEAARMVGMSRTSAYRLRERMASARFDAAFAGARRTGIRARAAASQARPGAPSRWEGPRIAELVARERARESDTPAAQSCALLPQGASQATQGDAGRIQGDASTRKVTP